MQYGLDAESVDPPLPTDSTTEVAAVPQESQQGVETVAEEDEPAVVVKAQPAQEAGVTETADPELSTEENALVQSVSEQERASLVGKLKAASFWGYYKDPNKPAEEVRQHLQDQSQSRYNELELATIAKAVDEPERLGKIFKSSPDLYGKLATIACDSDPDFFLQRITGKEGATKEQVVAALEGGTSAVAEAVTDDDLKELRAADFDEFADKLEAAREKAKEAKPETKTDEGGKPEPPNPVEIVEQFQTREREVGEAFEASIKPVVSYATKKMESTFGPVPTEQEYELAPDVAYLKATRLALFEHGDGKGLPSFRDGLGKWGEHRKIKEREFDSTIRRVGRFSESLEKENGAEAASELIPFADAYFNERAALPVFQAFDRLIALAASGTNPPVPKEHIVTGGVSQPTSSKPLSGAEWLVANAVERAG